MVSSLDMNQQKLLDRAFFIHSMLYTVYFDDRFLDVLDRDIAESRDATLANQAVRFAGSYTSTRLLIRLIIQMDKQREVYISEKIDQILFRLFKKDMNDFLPWAISYGLERARETLKLLTGVGRQKSRPTYRSKINTLMFMFQRHEHHESA